MVLFKKTSTKKRKKHSENLQLWALKRNTLFGYIQWLFEKKNVAILETFVSWGIYVSLENGFPVDGDTLRQILPYGNKWCFHKNQTTHQKVWQAAPNRSETFWHDSNRLRLNTVYWSECEYIFLLPTEQANKNRRNVLPQRPPIVFFAVDHCGLRFPASPMQETKMHTRMALSKTWRLCY